MGFFGRFLFYSFFEVATKNVEFMITFGGVFLRSFSSIATKRNQKVPPKWRGVQHFGFKIVFTMISRNNI